MKKKILIVAFVLIVMLSSVLIFLSNYCAYEKISMETPDFLRETQLSFNREMYYVEDLKEEYGGCLDVFKTTSRELMSTVTMKAQGELFLKDETYKKGEPKVRLVPKEMKFSVEEAFISRPAKYVKDGTDVYYLLLKDEFGELSTVSYQEFRPYKIGNSVVFPSLFSNELEFSKIVSNKDGTDFSGGLEFDLPLPSLPPKQLEFAYQASLEAAEDCQGKAFDYDWVSAQELNFSFLTTVESGGDRLGEKDLIKSDDSLKLDLERIACSENCPNALVVNCLKVNVKGLKQADYRLDGNFYAFVDGKSFSGTFGTEKIREFISGRDYLTIEGN